MSLVSIVIPLYNRAATIQRAIDSALNQTYTDIEVLVIDDGSIDNSVEMLDKYKNDDKVKIFCQETNQGANAARNRGIMEAVGEYIAFLDSDDEWFPEKLEKQLKCMEEGAFVASFCAYRRHFRDAVQIIPNVLKELSSSDIRKKLEKGNIIGTPTLIVHRKVIEEVGMFDEEMPRLQDYEFVIRVAKRFPICFVNEVLINEYEMTGCISHNRQNLHIAYALLLKKHADFVDVDFIWNACLESGGVFEKQVINWKKLDKIIDDITYENMDCTKDALYKATIHGMYDKYQKIKAVESKKYNVLLKELKDKKFVVYGAGTFARQLLSSLQEQQLLPECFLVTRKDGTDSIADIPVIQINSWKDKDIVVLIAVSGQAQDEVIENLERNEMYNFYIYPECI